MAGQKIRHVKEKVKNDYGTYDTVYRQTLSGLVITEDGDTLQNDLNALHSALQWQKYRGEYPYALTLSALGETFVLEQSDANKDISYMANADGAAGFAPSVLYYRVLIPKAYDTITVKMLSSAYHATNIELACGSNKISSTFENGAASVQLVLPTDTDQPTFSVRVYEDTEGSAWDRTYHFNLVRQGDAAFSGLTLGAEAGAAETMFKLWPGNDLPADFGAVVFGYLPDDPSVSEYSVLVNTLTTQLTIHAKAPAGSAIRLADMDGSQYAACVGTEVVQQYLVPAPTLSSSTEGGTDLITLNATLYLKPCYSGEQSILCIVTQPDGTRGGCKIKVYRDTQGNTASFQTQIVGTTSTSIRADRSAYITLYKKSDAMGYLSVVEATSGSTPLVKVPVGATYQDMFDAVVKAGHLTLVKRVVSDKTSGAYAFTDADISETGIYTLVASRPGFLDNVVDNLRVFDTFLPAQYTIRNMSVRSGDVNNDGIIDDADIELYNLYLPKFNTMQSPEAEEPFPSMLPFILDYNQDGKLDMVDLNSIVVNMTHTTPFHWWIDNATDPLGMSISAWNKQV